MIKVLSNLVLEDRIVLLRFVVGVVFGLAVFIASYFVPPITLSQAAWSSSILVYYATVVYVELKYRPTSRFQKYIRGLATFYGAWLLVAILLYEAAGYLGLRK